MKQRALALVCALGCLLGIFAARGDDPGLWREDAQRLRVGLKIFPAVLGAMEGLDRRTASDGALVILVVHSGPVDGASDVVRGLNAICTIRNLPLRVSAVAPEAVDQPHGPVAGVFIATVGVDSERLQAWSEGRGALVFSPFAGDVARGAVAGLYVADRVLPEVNLAAARRAGIGFKPFFLKVARHYE